MTSDVDIARTALTTASVLCGLSLIPFVETPSEAWVGGDALSGDWYPTFLALGMLALFSLIMTTPVLRTFFELTPLRGRDYVIITMAVIFWAILLRFIWRSRLIQRLLGLN